MLPPQIPGPSEPSEFSLWAAGLLYRILEWRPRNPIALLFDLRMSLAVAYAVIITFAMVLS